MKKLWQVYKMCIKNDIFSQTSYKKDFILQLIVWSIYTFLPFLSIVLLIENFGDIQGYTTYHIAIFYGVVTISHDFSRMVARGFDNFSILLISGDLDLFFIRPQPILIQVFGSSIFLRRLSGILQGLIILIGGLIPYGVDFCLWMAVLLIICATIILYMALLIIYSAICFYTIKDNLFSELIIDTSVSLSYYPMDVFKKPLRFIFTYIIPVACCIYYPLQQMLLYAHIAWSKIAFSWLCAGGMLMISILLFHCGLRRYRSVNN